MLLPTGKSFSQIRGMAPRTHALTERSNSLVTKKSKFKSPSSRMLYYLLLRRLYSPSFYQHISVGAVTHYYRQAVSGSENTNKLVFYCIYFFKLS